MAKFKCIRTCSGFQRRYWVEGQEVEVNEKDEEQPPYHFVRIDEYVAPKKEQTETAAVPLSSMHQNTQPSTGMSAGLQQTESVQTGSTVKRGRSKG